MSKSETQQVEVLKEFLGEEKAKQLVNLSFKYDKYVKRYKEKVNKLLEEVNYEVKLAHGFLPKKGEEDNAQ